MNMRSFVNILGTGSYLPNRVVGNSEITKTPQWVEDNLGIKSRRKAGNREDIAYMGSCAARGAMNAAKLKVGDIDLIISTCSSPEILSPSTACQIKKRLGIETTIPAFDLNAVCSGFVYAVNFIAPLIDLGIYKNVLIVSPEKYSSITDYTSRDCVFFGDGAGAVVLSKSDDSWLVGTNKSAMTTNGFELQNGCSYVMNAPLVKQAALVYLPDAINNQLKSSNLSASDIKMFIPHQASVKLLDEIATITKLENTKKIMQDYGNLASASIPIAMADAIKNNEIQRGDLILLAAIGSGWTYGTTIIRY